MKAMTGPLACPALFISAPASGQGKTTLTAGLARLHRRKGKRVRVFKTGPDFLDPMILAHASGAPVMSLDLWMVGEAGCRALLAQAAHEADLILIEGVMGLFDGTPSSADLAAKFGVPVAAVIGANSMAQTFGAIAFGLAHYRADVPFHGVLANRVGSARHAQMLQEGMPDGLRWLGHVASDAQFSLPDRHLGLHQASEIDDLDARIERAADALEHTALAALPPAVTFEPPAAEAALPRWLEGRHIAIARDAAFSFLYPANLALLEALGARLSFFSPLADETAPADASAVYLPGGYPELHAATLAANTRSAASLRAHAEAGKPLVAECGGMLYLLDALTTVDGTRTPMLGLLPGDAAMQKRFAALGMQRLDGAHGTLTGHTFHYSRVSTPLAPALRARHAQTGADGEALYRHGAITATYMHAYWPSNPAFAAALFHGTTL
ncbi:cobyrinate a,c-diamide synthase [Paraburkholderia sp. Ac-20340]|uniref:cobyrinate a,c-diamide synthase n=1 Tax=Paraburkholderia sp. Ac-20340 TaxID=2703888 RepID=UPI001F11DFF0|nr:cobyrinate a,c-diamide synthase [Paraburkholderia sp. Ac-20340]